MPMEASSDVERYDRHSDTKARLAVKTTSKVSDGRGMKEERSSRNGCPAADPLLGRPRV